MPWGTPLSMSTGSEAQPPHTTHDLALNLNNKGQTDVVLLNFSKAFDKVPH